MALSWHSLGVVAVLKMARLVVSKSLAAQNALGAWKQILYL